MTGEKKEPVKKRRITPRTSRKGDSTLMTPLDLEIIMSELFGARGWKTRLCELLEVEPSTVTRWCNGRNPIPKWLTVLAWALVQLRQRDVAIPDEFWASARRQARSAQIVE